MNILPARTLNRIKVQSFYSGDSGFYCCMFPTGDSLRTIVNLFKRAPSIGQRMVMPSLQHVTIMYSHHAIPIEELPWIERDAIIVGNIVGYDLFIKPGKETGAVVALLESPGLVGYHQQLEKMAEYTWDEFKPHLTVAYDVTPTDAALMISELSALPMPKNLSFTAPVFEDKS